MVCSIPSYVAAVPNTTSIPTYSRIPLFIATTTHDDVVLVASSRGTGPVPVDVGQTGGVASEASRGRRRRRRRRRRGS